MKIKLKNTPEQVALFKALASNDSTEKNEAQEVLAAFLGPVIQQVIANAPTLANFFTDMPFDKFAGPRTIPLDLYYDIKETTYVRVWSQTMAGGMPTQQTHPPVEMPFATYTLDSAITFDKKFAAQARLDVIGKSINRMLGEVLDKQDLNAAAILLSALANASTTVAGVATRHVIRATAANQFVFQDLNRLFTLIKRIRSSWTGGTPDVRSARGLTTLAVSPEIMEFIRGLAYNPVNTRGTVTNIPATDAQREAIHNSVGNPNFMGVDLVELNELGVGYRWNTVFDVQAGSTTYPNYAGTGSAAAFDGGAEELIIGVDEAMETLVRPVATDSERGDTFTVLPDDQFVSRQKRVGFYGEMEEGRLVLDDRSVVGMVV
jgi:hypothetical protein